MPCSHDQTQNLKSLTNNELRSIICSIRRTISRNRKRCELVLHLRGLKGLNFTEFLLLLRQEVTPTDKEEIDAIFQQLSQHRPAQYIISKAGFSWLGVRGR